MNGDKQTVLQEGVQYIDHMGDDLSVVNAARVSMAKESSCLDDRDKGLIKYLAKHNHWTPFGQTAIKFRIKMPIFVARQWFKHTVGFVRNEVSRRYVDSKPDFWYPRTWRAKADNVKQGSDHNSVAPVSHELYTDHIDNIIAMYEEMITENVCPEQARMILPQSMITEFIETGNLSSYARLCKLRLDSHAQLETQWYAEAISNHISKLYPESWKALMEEYNDEQ